MIFEDLSELQIEPDLDRWPASFQEYLLGRGVSASAVRTWNLGFFERGPLQNRIYVPIDDQDGTKFYAARSIVASEQRWSFKFYPMPSLRPVVWFGQRFWPIERKVVVVVEGVFDALRLHHEFLQLPLAAFHVQNVTQPSFDLLGTFSRVLVLTDSDVHGDRIALRTEHGVKNTGTGSIVERIRLSSSKDPSEASREELCEVLGRVVELT